MSSSWPSGRTLAGAGLLVLALFFAREPLLHGQTFFLRDLHLQWFGQVESFVHAVAEGAWPVWDPFPSFGQPMLANPNTQVLYPFTWLNLVLRPWTFYTLYFVAHLLIAGTGAVAAARCLGASPLAALGAGALWLASGPLLSLGNLWNHLGAAAWLPWAIAAAVAPTRHAAWRSALGWGAAIGLMVLAGSPDMALLGGLASGALCLSREAPFGARLARAALAALYALALSAGQWWPALDWARIVGRLDLPPAVRLYWSVDPAALWQSLLPVPWERMADLAATAPREPFLLSLYVGLPTLGLALLGGLRGHRRTALTLAALAVLAVLLSLGAGTPLYGWLSETLPVLRPLRFPAKALVPAACLLCLLAALGLDAWREALAQRRWRDALVPALPLLPLLLLAGTSVAGALARPLLLAALVAAVAARALIGSPRAALLAPGALLTAAVVDLALAHATLNPTAPRALLAVEPPVARELRDRRSFVFDYQAQPGLAERLLGRPFPLLLAVSGPGDLAATRAAMALRSYPVPPMAAAWRGRGAWGRDLLGLQPRHFNRLSGLVILTQDAGLRLWLLQLAGVERVVALHGVGLEPLGTPRGLPGPFSEAIRVYDVPRSLPRAYAVGRAEVLPDEQAELRLATGRLELGRETLLAPGARPGPPGGFPSPAEVRLVAERADRLDFELDLPADGWLVVNDLWSPDWVARVDGRAVKVERANLLFRAIPVPAGRHRALLLCRPRGLLSALALSAGAALAGLAAALRASRDRPA